MAPYFKNIQYILQHIKIQYFKNKHNPYNIRQDNTTDKNKNIAKKNIEIPYCHGEHSDRAT